ncbi:minor capsid protein [Capnocytophaga canis]|uniref:minor capsid protein n=1 Tax=Capnocytophaga canis TaxID=1848903 RepID=UPI001561D4F7|nr:minor capsid protein [Capnocytophaga canis]
MKVIQYVYRLKRLPDELINRDIVTLQAQTLIKPIDRILQDVDWNSPDYIMREILKKNMWHFSVAKNYNDCVAINNLLIREDGSLRPWHDFKREAQKIAGNSARYLKTEYNTVVAGAQMSRKWQEIQRDKHLFPYVMFDVVNDRHTSDICRPLHNVIVTVDDPMLMYYFPPNHFNCRTDVRRLRYGKPTEKYRLPEIPEAFKNNVGMSGSIFTDKNKYIENTPAEVLKNADTLHKIDILSKPREEQFKLLFEAENGGKVLEHLLLQKGKDYDSILTSAIEFAKQGKTAEILPVINQKELKEYRKSVFLDYDLNKNPDLRVDGVYYDIKEVESLKKIQRNANKASIQGAVAIIQYNGEDLTQEAMEQQVRRIFGANNIDKNGIHNYPYQLVYFLHKGKLYKYNRG